MPDPLINELDLQSRLASNPLEVCDVMTLAKLEIIELRAALAIALEAADEAGPNTAAEELLRVSRASATLRLHYVILQGQYNDLLRKVRSAVDAAPTANIPIYKPTKGAINDSAPAPA